MNPHRLTPQPALTADELLAADRLLDELLLELSGDVVVGLETRRAGGPVGEGSREAAQRRASA